MRNGIVSGVLAITGVIHILALAGVAGSNALERIYGVTTIDPNVELLLRHRAILFGLLGTGFLIAAFRRDWQPFALAVAIVSTASFVLLGWMLPERNEAIDRVVLVDLVLAPLLVVASVLRAQITNLNSDSDPS